MTRKDFELIAAALRDAKCGGYYASEYELRAAVDRQHLAAVQQVARALATTNPRFDMPRFLAAAGAL